MPDSTALAVLKIKGLEDRDIYDFNFEFTQASDKENQPSGIPRPGKISIKVNALVAENTSALLNWMIKRSVKNGSIILKSLTSANDEYSEIKFEDALCVNYKLTGVEKWVEKGALTEVNTIKDKASVVSPGFPTLIEDIQIVWRKMTWGTVVYENDWM